MKNLKIRAHHLLCIQGFQGYGYNQDFVDNMNLIIKEINLNPDLTIELTDECDSVCEHCPHYIDKACQSAPNADARVKKMDTLVFSAMKVSPGTRGKVGNFLSIVNDRFQTLSHVKKVCGTCMWKKKCLWYKNRK